MALRLARSGARATAMMRFIFFPSMSRRAILGTLPACARSLALCLPEPETCYLPRRTTINGSRNRGSAGRAPLLEGGLAEHRLL